MPLKHFTETVFIIILGLAIVVTGFLVSLLPLLPEGILPALILLGVTLLYPFVLYPFFRANRADNAFRSFHFAPAAIVLLWMLLQGLALWMPKLQSLTSLFIWGFALGPVLVAFFLLMIFCLSVIRRWVPRLAFLTLILVPFVLLGVASTLNYHWDHQVATRLWQGTWWNITSTGSARLPGGFIAFQNTSSVSSDPKANDWKEKIEDYEDRSSSIAAAAKSSSKAASSRSSARSSSSKRSVSSHSSSSRSALPSKTPPTTPKPTTPLPSSGIATEVLPFALLAGYGTLVQRRAKKRSA